MRVLVTGATGFVGSHTAAAIAAAGHELRLLVRDRAKAKRVLAVHGLGAVDLALGDVTEPASVAAALEGCDAAVHAAAVVALEAHRAEEARHTNARGVEVVLGEAARRGLRSIVYVSSAAALCVPGGPPIHADAPIAEANSPYARSKAEGERFARGLLEAGAPIRVSYPVGVIGPDDPGLSETNHMLQVLVRDFVPLTTSGVSVVDVRDLARVHAALLDDRVAPGRYVASGHFLPWREVAGLIERLTGRKLRKVRLPGGLLRAAGRVGDAVKRFAPFDFPLTYEAMTFATRWPGADGSTTSALTGVEPRDAAESFADSLRWLAAAGHLRPEQVGRLAA